MKAVRVIKVNGGSILDSSKSPDLRIALVGTSPTSRLFAPCHDPAWQIWACSPDNKVGLSRIDAWFELHNISYPEYQVPLLRSYIEWLRQQAETKAFTVYAQNQSFIPNAVVFPKDELVKTYGCRFFTSSFAWMLAFALMKGAKVIGLFGIDMADAEEYRRQRAGVHHFLQIAEGRGVKIVAPSESDIMQPAPLYGYDRNSPFVCRLEARRGELSAKIAYLKQQRADLERHICMIKGAMDAALVEKVTKNPDLINAKLAEMDAMHKQISYHDAQLSGAREDIDYMLTIWAGVTHSAYDYDLSSLITSAPSHQTPTEFPSNNPYDIIAMKARKGLQQAVPYQPDDPLVAEPSLLV